MKYHIFIFVSFLAMISSARAEESSGRNLGLDYGASFLGRTYPLSAALVLDAGYNLHLWGEWEKKDDVMYGYIRPSVSAATSLIVNMVEARLTVKPVSFLGLHAGRFLMARDRYESTDVDCGAIECRGTLDNEFLSADAALAVGPVFYTGNVEYKDVKSLRGETDFYEDIAAIMGSRAKDRFVTSGHTLGYRFQDDPLERLVGLNYKRADAENSRQFSENVGFIYGQRFDDYRVVFLAGNYRSSIQKSGPMLGLSVTWMGGLQGLSL